MRKKADSTLLRTCRSYVKTILPEATAKQRGNLKVWDVYAKPGAQSHLDFGFSLLEAWWDAATRLGLRMDIYGRTNGMRLP